jgi:hemerythrin superfamily protein
VPPAAGEALYEELLWVHSMVRRDLETVRKLAAAVTNGRPAEEIQAELDELKTNGTLWKLKVNCLNYCGFVHAHHNAEDRMLFPALRQANPELGPIVDRLEADHRTVSLLLDDVEAAARELSAEAEAKIRASVSEALEALSGHLLEHLDFEEESVAETMRSLGGLPGR